MDQLKKRPPKKKRIVVDYGKAAGVIRTNLKASLYEQLFNTKDLLESSSGLDFSATILVRRALQEYLERLQKMDQHALESEARHLINHYR